MVIRLFRSYAIEVKKGQKALELCSLEELLQMPAIIRVGDLEVDQDLEFQQRSWTVQRIGWIVMPLIVLAALLGLLGPGPLSSAAAGSEAGPLWLEYERLGHWERPTTLQVHLGANVAAQGLIRIWLDSAYVEKMQIEQVTPQPESVALAANRLIYTFQIVEPGQPTSITFHLKPEKFGLSSGEVGLVEGSSLQFSQFIYP
jgi:hypothetical protein